MFAFRRSLLIAGLAGLTSFYGTASQAAVTPLELVKPLAAYKVYVTRNVEALVAGTGQLVAAVKAGNIDSAKQLFPVVRTHYERIEPVAELFSDMDSAIDSRANDHEKREQDPAFGGFHRIEYGLWVQGDTKGIVRHADKLLSDVQELQKRLKTLTFPPEDVVGGGATLMEEVAATKISGEEDRYSHTDLYDFQANFEGAYKIVDLLRPLITREDPAFMEKTEANFKTVFNTLKKYRTQDGGFQSYEKLTEADRRVLAGRVNTLAEDLSTLRGKFGLN